MMKKCFILFVILTVGFLSYLPLGQAAIPVIERAALIALYNSTNGDTWAINSGWKTPPLHTDGFAMPGTENTWKGVITDIPNTKVDQLVLNNNKLSGIIPPELANINGLKYLYLNNNHLRGSIPLSFINLTNLVDDSSDYCGNHLYTSDDALRIFLNSKQIGGDWEKCQISLAVTGTYLLLLSEPFCGDGNIDPGEECDDGNTDPGDGCDAGCMLESPAVQVPLNQFNIGDSIGEGEAANGTIGDPNHKTVWSTGYDAGDIVDSLNERFENTNVSDYYENDGSRDIVFNHAASGAVMADFETQALAIVAAAYTSTPSNQAGMITILLGNNDVCATSLDAMTDPNVFENQYRAGLDVFVGSVVTNSAYIHVSSIPAIYWLWNAKRDNWWCRIFVWPKIPCENLLASPGDDCASTVSRLDPDTIYEGDGANCVRRKTFHAKIRDIYNPILRDVLQEYKDNGKLPNAYFIDVFDVQFEDSHINGGDCFHPSESGHALLSEKEWCRSQWGADDFICIP